MSYRAPTKFFDSYGNSEGTGLTGFEQEKAMDCYDDNLNNVFEAAK